MKTTKEMIEVMQAYEDGKTIQAQSNSEDWSDIDAPFWAWDVNDYRIKPEPKEPTYRPYESVAEMLCDYKSRVCKTNDPENTKSLIWLKHNLTEVERAVTGVDRKCDQVLINHWCYMSELYNYYHYLDGTPVGKLVE